MIEKQCMICTIFYVGRLSLRKDIRPQKPRGGPQKARGGETTCGLELGAGGRS